MFWPGLRYSSVYPYQLGNYPTEEERERESLLLHSRIQKILILRKLISTSVIFQGGGSGPPAPLSLDPRVCLF